MLDELVVKCPNTKSGCNWVDQRVNVHDHVMLYCEYALVECPSYDCRLHISQRDFHKGCLHVTVSCEDCHTSMMKKDVEVRVVIPVYLMSLNVVRRSTRELPVPIDPRPALTAL